MEEGVIASWLVKVGDSVKSGDILAEVETDKATMELESYEDGTILHLGVKEKESVKIDGVIAIIGTKGESIDGLLQESTAQEPEQKEAPVAENLPAEEIDTSGINASLITMPKMSDTMTEGVIANWLKKVGDDVKSGDIIAEVETDKATMELEAYEDGKLLYIGVEAGSSVPIDGVIAVVGEEGADYETLIKAQSSPSEAKAPEADAQKGEAPLAPAEQKMEKKLVESASSTNGRLKASPLSWDMRSARFPVRVKEEEL